MFLVAVVVAFAIWIVQGRGELREPRLVVFNRRGVFAQVGRNAHILGPLKRSVLRIQRRLFSYVSRATPGTLVVHLFCNLII